MKKVVFFSFLCLFVSSFCKGQWVYAEIGVNGLTCSMCTKSVDNALSKLSFVERVGVNLETTAGRIYFKEGSQPNLAAINKAVEDAGFSLRYLKIHLSFKNQAQYAAGECFILEGVHYQLLDSCTIETKEASFLVVNKSFMPKKAFKNWRSEIGKICWKEDFEQGYFLHKE